MFYRRMSYLLAFLAVMAAFLGGGMKRTAAQGPTDLARLKIAFWRDQRTPPVLARADEPAPTMIQPEAAAQGWDYWSRITLQYFAGGSTGWDIMMMNGPIYSYPEYIIRTPATELRPTLNRDASQVAFTSNESGAFTLYVADADGGNPHRITSSGDDYYADWSPDNAWLAFAHAPENGPWDIYRVHPDGSQQQRLTRSHQDDIMPDWSPDGTKIAWVKRQGEGRGDLWIMNADGGNPYPLLKSLKFLQNPRWSPDGKFIAFDYDADGDGLNEIGAVNADGSGLHVVFDANQEWTDAWMGAWSPGEGREILINLVTYVVQDDRLYIRNGRLARFPLNGDPIKFYHDTSGVQLYPDWRSVDADPPQSQMEPLPPWGPTPFWVRWSATDRGPSGLFTCDVQVMDVGHTGWEDWITDRDCTDETNRAQQFTGIGGHAYLFRVRARDRAGNVEPWPDHAQTGMTVENLPPVSELTPLKPYERRPLWLKWHGYDPGDSGVEAFYIQVKEEPDGEWRDLLTDDWNPPDEPATGITWWRGGETGKSYAFRIRAVDRAKNEEAWHSETGDVRTTLYGWMIDGRAFDNRGRPVQGMEAVTDPPGFDNFPSDEEGHYAVYGHADVKFFDVRWQRAGFGDLPKMSYDARIDAHQDVMLPPLENAIQDGGFESGSLDPHWQPALDGGALLITNTFHTGDFAIQLTCPEPRTFSEPDYPPNGPFSSTPQGGFQAFMDDAGRIHLIRRLLVKEDNQSHLQLTYTRRNADGSWLPLGVIVDERDGYGTPTEPRLAVSPNGAAAVIWETGLSQPIMFASRPVDGPWSEPEAITPAIYLAEARIAMDSADAVHVVYRGEGNSNGYPLLYITKPQGGSWSQPVQIAPRVVDSVKFWLLTDGKDQVHLVWEDINRKLWHRLRTPEGQWTDAQQIFDWGWGSGSHTFDQYYFGVDDVGGIHFLFFYDTRLQAYYVQRRPDGVVTQPFRVDEPTPYAWGGYPLDFAQFQVAKDGTVHVTWRLQTQTSDPVPRAWIAHRVRTPEGAWRDIEYHRIPNDANSIRTAVDDAGRLHFMAFSTDNIASASQLIYFLEDHGDWSLPQRLAISPHGVLDGAAIFTAPDDVPHFLWEEGDPWYHNTVIAHAQTIHQTQQPQATYALQQLVTVPADETAPTLALLYRLEGSYGDQGTAFSLMVDDGESQTFLATTRENTDADGWDLAWADLSPWAGEQVHVGPALQQAQGQVCARVIVDEVSLGEGAHPDLWVSGGVGVGEPGEETDLLIRYGNQGDAAAPNAQLRIQPPAALTLVTADPPPASHEGEWLWTMGDLPAGDDARVIRITVRIDAATPPATVLRAPITFSSDAIELNENNNQDAAILFVSGRRIFLPRVAK